jgi:hypothetical protein
MEIVLIVLLSVGICFMVVWKLFLIWFRPKFISVWTIFTQNPSEWFTWKDIKIRSRQETWIVLFLLQVLSAPNMPMSIRLRSPEQQKRLSQLLEVPIPSASRSNIDEEIVFYEFQFNHTRGIGSKKLRSLVLGSLIPIPVSVPA